MKILPCKKNVRKNCTAMGFSWRESLKDPAAVSPCALGSLQSPGCSRLLWSVQVQSCKHQNLSVLNQGLERLCTKGFGIWQHKNNAANICPGLKVSFLDGTHLGILWASSPLLSLHQYFSHSTRLMGWGLCLCQGTQKTVCSFPVG